MSIVLADVPKNPPLGFTGQLESCVPPSPYDNPSTSDVNSKRAKAPVPDDPAAGVSGKRADQRCAVVSKVAVAPAVEPPEEYAILTAPAVRLYPCESDAFVVPVTTAPLMTRN